MSSAARSTNLFKVAIVGASCLKGKEVRDVLNERTFPAIDIKLLDDEDAAGQLDQVNDEPTFIQGVTPGQLSGVDFTFLTADQDYTVKVWDIVRRSGSEVIDLSYALEKNAESSLRAPWVEHELGRPHQAGLQSVPVVVAHPAAVMLALLLARLEKAVPLQMASAVVSQPASEYGRAGLDELHDQTVNLLSFQQMPTAVFGAQISFNVAAHSAPEARQPLAEVEARILRHYQAITGGGVAVPALLLQQAPVFHGYTAAIYVRTRELTTSEALEGALRGAHVRVSAEAGEHPSNINIPGQPDILASVKADASGGNGYWIFAACDNLRISAEQAVECAEEMLHTRPRGQLQ
ncbi:MAG: Asd/ArgC dimerization domain-containing protein [Acidobacteriota bacterium]|nr:Asd/ArgC dimerization domain-containing protein [Acidobacteriota bacterium]